MHKRTSTKKEDVNELAVSIVEAATGTTIKEKNPAAVALGRLGGLKGGRGRANRLSPERRKEIASKAASIRWQKKNQ